MKVQCPSCNLSHLIEDEDKGKEITCPSCKTIFRVELNVTFVKDVNVEITTSNKLYVWEDVYSDYTPGIAFAIAGSIEEARILIAGNKDSSLYKEIAGMPSHVHALYEKVGYHVSGGS